MLLPFLAFLLLVSDYRNIEYWTSELEKLSDSRISIELSDIVRTKKYRLPSSGIYIIGKDNNVNTYYMSAVKFLHCNIIGKDNNVNTYYMSAL